MLITFQPVSTWSSCILQFLSTVNYTPNWSKRRVRKCLAIVVKALFPGYRSSSEIYIFRVPESHLHLVVLASGDKQLKQCIALRIKTQETFHKFSQNPRTPTTAPKFWLGRWGSEKKNCDLGLYPPII